jgi:hypothetical protein
MYTMHHAAKGDALTLHGVPDCLPFCDATATEVAVFVDVSSMSLTVCACSDVTVIEDDDCPVLTAELARRRPPTSF